MLNFGNSAVKMLNEVDFFMQKTGISGQGAIIVRCQFSLATVTYLLQVKLPQHLKWLIAKKSIVNRGF